MSIYKVDAGRVARASDEHDSVIVEDIPVGFGTAPLVNSAALTIIKKFLYPVIVRRAVLRLNQADASGGPYSLLVAAPGDNLANALAVSLGFVTAGGSLAAGTLYEGVPVKDASGMNRACACPVAGASLAIISTDDSDATDGVVTIEYVLLREPVQAELMTAEAVA